MLMFSIGLLFLWVAAILAGIRGDDGCKPNIDILSKGEKCCRFPPEPEIESIMKECKATYDDPTCKEFDCVFEKLNLITDDKIDLKAMATTNMYNPDEEAFKAAVEGIKLQCIKDLSDYAYDIPCESLKVVVCSQHIMTAACPDQLWVNSEECDALRSYVYKCPPI